MQANNQAAGAVRRLALGLTAAGTLAVVVAACGGAGSTGTGGGTTGAASSLSAAASSAAGTSGDSGSGSAAGPVDPCQVVTASEASQLVGKTLSQTVHKGRICTYASGIEAVVTVFVRRFPASAVAAHAQTYYNKAVQQFSNRPGVVLSHPGVADKSLAGSITLAGVRKLSAIAFLKGNVYVSIEAIPGPSLAALTSLATVAAGRV